MSSSQWKPPAGVLPGGWQRVAIALWQHEPGRNRRGSGRVVYDARVRNSDSQFVLQFLISEASRPESPHEPAAADSSGASSGSRGDATGSTVLFRPVPSPAPGEETIVAGSSGSGAAIETLSVDEPPPRSLPDRFVLDLSGHSADGWRPAVIVTRIGSDIRSGDHGYRIAKFGGIGGLGEVWLAHDLSARPVSREPDVALKFFTLSVPGGEAGAAGVEGSGSQPFVQAYSPVREGEIGRELFTESTRRGLEQIAVRTRAVLTLAPGTHSGWPRVVIVMDRAAASLADVIDWCRDGQLPVAVISHVWSRLARCLELLHRGFRRVHRDLKPANVMFVFDDGRVWDELDLTSLLQARVLLGDLASVKPVGADVELFGQDTFKAPELFQRDENGKVTGISKKRFPAQPWEDLYALGRIAQEMAGVLHPADGGSDWLQQLGARLTDVDPARRLNGIDGYRMLALLGLPANMARKDFLQAGGFRPDRHPKVYGRDWVLTDPDGFREFCRQQTQAGRGGLFLIVAPPGLGKSALLTAWSSRPDLVSDSVPVGTAIDAASGLHPSFYFRFTESRVSREAMLRTLSHDLAQRFGLTAPTGPQIDSGTLRELARQAAEKLPAGKRLVLIVDGLDEASSPGEVIESLPVEPPAGVFVVVSSRPEFQDGKDHLSPLRAARWQAYVREFPLDPQDARNIRDGVEFWEGEYQRLAGQPFGEVATGPGESRELVVKNNGLFLILRTMLNEMFPGQAFPDRPDELPSMTLADVRNQKRCLTLLDFHKEQWQRITASLEDAARTRLVTFVTLLAAVQDTISVDELQNILGSSACRTPVVSTEVKGFVTRTRWLLDRHDQPMVTGRKTTLVQRKHQTVLDFLTAEDGPAREFGLELMHQIAASHYLTIAWGEQWRDREASHPEPAEWRDVDDYGLEYLARHLLLSVIENNPSRKNGLVALRLLRDQFWLEERVARSRPVCEVG